MPFLPVQEVMSKVVATIRPEQPVLEAIETMRQRNYSCLVVIDEAGRPTGMITERDVLRLANLLLRGTDGSQLRAQAIMTHPAITIRSSANATEAIALIRERKIRHLPVIGQDGKLAGILTQSDLVTHALACFPTNVYGNEAEEGDIGDGIPPVNLDKVEEELKGIFNALHTEKNPSGSARLQSRFI